MTVRQRPTLALFLLWASLYLPAALLLAWSRDGSLPYLAGAYIAGAIAAGVTWRLHRQVTRRRPFLIAGLLLVLGAAGALPVVWQLRRLNTEWETLEAQRGARARADLTRRVNEVLAQGREAVDAVAATNAAFLRTARQPYADAMDLLEDQRLLFRELEAVHARSKVDAVAIFGDSTELFGWAGEHRGALPNDARMGPDRIVFVERPLYSYLFFIKRHQSGIGRAVAAILLDAALPSENDPETVRNQTQLVGGRSTFFQPGPGGPDDWALAIGADTILHARLEPVSQAEWRQQILRAGQRFEAAVLLVAVLLLAIIWFREPTRPARLTALVPFLGTAAALVTAPLGSATGLQDLFSPGLFLLPGPGTVSLGTMLAVLGAAGVAVSTTRPRLRIRHPVAFLIAAIVFAAALPFIVQILIGPPPTWLQRWYAPSPPLLEGASALWAGLQGALVLLLSIALTATLMLARIPTRLRPTARHQSSVLLLSAGIGAATLAGLLVLMIGHARGNASPYLALLWLIALLPAGFGASAYQRDGRRLVRWLTAGWIVSTLVLPFLWIASVHTRLDTAERKLETLGKSTDPYLEYLLRQYGREAIARRELLGEDRLQLIYRSWVTSGLAREPYAVRIMLWDSLGRADVQLPLGDPFRTPEDRLLTIPSYMTQLFVRVQELAHPQTFAVPTDEDVIQVLVVPLDQKRMLTVEVPPRQSFDRADVIAPLLGSAADEMTRLSLVPAREAGLRGGPWRRTAEGWRSEALVRFPRENFHAHIELRIPSLGVLIARGALILAATLLVMVLMWLAGRATRDEPVSPAGGWFGWLGSFRARVTAALFAFFLIPTLLFGWVAYGALAGEVERAGRLVAERAVRQAVTEFREQTDAGRPIDLTQLAQHAGEEVLTYSKGELLLASSPEAVELGVYDAWMPANIYLLLESGEEEAEVAANTGLRNEFLTAFRRLEPAGTGSMAVPVRTQSGESVIRQREFLHIILFAALVGGLLSLALSVAVGRTLARPISRLQRAAAAIGAGRLNVQLPEQTGDEFGRLFASFNRMVRRLRRARAQEIKSARVLAWGEMARQVAHEIKNPLTPIKLSVQHLRRAFKDRRTDFENILEQNADQILIEIDRLTDIARAFSRYGAPAQSGGPLEPVNVSGVVHEALTLYRTGDPQLQYVDDVEAGLPPVMARSGELKEVFFNLLENARAATDAGGTISVVARRDNSLIELRIQDTGSGMPPEQLARIFEPHFSTRTTGTGLGLAIVRRLVESWGGTVDAESTPGVGTVIRVRMKTRQELPESK